MALRVDRIVVDNPRPAHQDFKVPYAILNDGPDEPPFEVHIQMWGSNGSQVVDLHDQLPAVDAGLELLTQFEVSSIEPGIYDVSITLPDGSGKGDTIHVQ